MEELVVSSIPDGLRTPVLYDTTNYNAIRVGSNYREVTKPVTE